MIVASPLRRTLQTAIYSFQPAIERGVKIVALAELQETSDVACDTGIDVIDLEREFTGFQSKSKLRTGGAAVVDLSFVPPDWNKKVCTVQIIHVFVQLTAC